MTLSNETQSRISEFAKDQSHHYLDAAQMTYLEKLQRKMRTTKHKATRKLNRFKSRSEQSIEAHDDMTLYMNDYVEDLISQGLSEEEAFSKAQADLAHDSDSDLATDIQERYVNQLTEYFAHQDPSLQEAIGLYYAAGVLIGLVLGTLAGLAVGLLYLGDLFWIGAIVGFVAGLLLGVGVAMLFNARALNKAHKA
jgi:hypothetical protein